MVLERQASSWKMTNYVEEIEEVTDSFEFYEDLGNWYMSWF